MLYRWGYDLGVGVQGRRVWGGMDVDNMYDMWCMGVMCQCGLGLMEAMLFMRAHAIGNF